MENIKQVSFSQDNEQHKVSFVVDKEGNDEVVTYDLSAAQYDVLQDSLKDALTMAETPAEEEQVNG